MSTILLPEINYFVAKYANNEIIMQAEDEINVLSQHAIQKISTFAEKVR